MSVRFKNTDAPTEEQWEEIFVKEKHYLPGDIVEYGHNRHTGEDRIAEVLEYKWWHPYHKDMIYDLMRPDTGEFLRASSTYMFPMGTFIDTKATPVIKERKPLKGFKCSNCGNGLFEVIIPETKRLDTKTIFCTKCGAHMNNSYKER